MFFESADINFRILTVLDIDRVNNKGYSGLRPFHALSFRVVGDATFTHDGETVSVRSNDMLFVPKNHPYWISSGREKLFVVHFETNAKLPNTIKKLTLQYPERYHRDLSRLFTAWTLRQIGFEHECKHLLHKILMNIERDAVELHNTSDRLDEAVEYIHEHFCDRELNVGLLAKMCSVSDTYFRKLFKAKYSVTPLKYINTLKVNYATELLRSGYYTVTEVAEKTGFDNVYYFSLFIKKETGKTPSLLANFK